MKKTAILLAFIAITATSKAAGGKPTKTTQSSETPWYAPGGSFDATVSYWINWFGATRN